ncbi:MAG: hypothetical protein GY795_29145 [Desulfobacterales bacterium]|nr:hypothetical protein [Desulfobacterales bacterium]
MRLTKKVLMTVIISLLVIIVSAIVFRAQIVNAVLAIKYDEEMGFVKKFLFYLSQKNTAEIRKLSDANADFLIPSYLNAYAETINRTDISSMKIVSVTRYEGTGDDLLIVSVFFENNFYLWIDFHLKYQTDRWMLNRLMFGKYWGEYTGIEFTTDVP